MDAPKKIRITDVNVAMTKAGNYCAYQERSQQEVRNKLYEWGLWTDAVENIITRLIEENYLNEERFAKAYTKGKFNQKGWGKIKIKQGLKLKNVSPALIKKALLHIDASDYMGTLIRLVEKKAATLPEKDPYKRRYKLQQYALSRGFETELTAEVLKNSEL
ncbi:MULTISPECIES: regulatory protein RecX [unclassified Mucilaginibacter]|uniref:regulatory protein RecX n=1 Tax=unclassified Mucilaginibacter TaxID=2617802 RepID=UPI002AC8AB0C|nr:MULTISPECIES: regulatory protein RecX [unclassified Mucilaginibacter]MEB0262680.1 regulatory protein RecX [Mucilaginibacter sp. 10I4]MEB0279482.1 regulatory protein RecX [Mucilaginibacter sp. 10B2]MEB0300043.1 regulatory protein RecX [Mucilaginibacter sp. 5C4]WPX21856.1 regulatory protein RecX [Mucilaginibacter sp. 5C4]